MSFLRFLFKGIVGIFAALGLLVLLLGLLVGAFFNNADDLTRRAAKQDLPAEIILTIDLSEGIWEGPVQPSFLSSSLQPGLPLHDAIEALYRAQGDDRVKGLLIRAGQGSLGLASAQELRRAVRDFTKSGKWSASFAETYGEAGHGTLHYYLASAAENIWIQPSGDLDISGFSMEIPYLRPVLDEFGVQPQFSQRHEFKGVMNTFTDGAMPEPVRQNTKAALDSILEQIANEISISREKPGEIISFMNQAPFSALQALDNDLVDRVGYWDELLSEALVENREFVHLSDYTFATQMTAPENAPRIAVIYGQGEIHLGDSQGGSFFDGGMSMGSNTIAEALSDAIDDDTIKAILLRVDSPGGSYVASDVMWREVQRARELGKPVIVSMGEVAASGGYFISAPADRIFANPVTITGSIGVAGGKMVLTGLWDKIGVKWDGVKAGENADLYSANKAFDSDGWTHLHDSLDRIYEDFTLKVSEGRGMSQPAVHTVAKGQIWSGTQAKKNGLVDDLGGFREALQATREMAAIDEETQHELVILPVPKDPLEELLDGILGSSMILSDPAVASSVKEVVRVASPFLQEFQQTTKDRRASVLYSGLPRLTDQ
ncbi:signal peptide peptidase SppA [Kiloniella laminariae]|uniref:Signal peptide peptidase SppA n=1 Tax=Kiloniella laminariae TaxID=454162 RepID=A0ABT4LE13_9PROT|nr:signal peptide peptidase SppA [Kiloniella laminariae]MCZ4279343.1 signal peptide peptidase SppA [Kiloniella laminariae]